MSETKYLLDDEIATAPRNEVGTGTIETNKLGLIGTGTKFKTELRRGAFIVDVANGVIVQIDNVVSDEYAILMEPFPSELTSGTQMDYIPAWKGNVREIATIVPVYKQDGTTENSWAKIDGVDTPPGVGENGTKVHRDRSSGGDVIRPIFIDATSTQVLVDLTF